jgi:hypothetical protein
MSFLFFFQVWFINNLVHLSMCGTGEKHLTEGDKLIMIGYAYATESQVQNM